MPRELPQRRTIRLRGYDYAQQGAYYLTMCTEHRIHHFGKIENKKMFQNDIGNIAEECWNAVPEHMPHVDIGQFIVMPNHVHGIVIIRERLSVIRNETDDAPGTNANDESGTNTHDANANPIHPDPLDRNGTNTNMPDMDTNDANAQHTRALHDDDANARGQHTRARHDDDANARGQHTRTRHDAPLPTQPGDQRVKPPGIPHGALGQIVASYKTAVTRIAYQTELLPRNVSTPSVAEVWQRNYWDRIIRNDDDHDRIAQYIAENPENWKGDRFHR